MKKIIHKVIKVVFSILLLMPILGLIGIFPPPTRDLYTTDIAFNFISILIEVGYINYLMVLIQFMAFIALWTKREALAALLLTPITANIIGFHLFLDGGLFTGGAIIANVFLAFNLYFLWLYRKEYENLWKKRT